MLHTDLGFAAPLLPGDVATVCAAPWQHFFTGGGVKFFDDQGRGVKNF